LSKSAFKTEVLAEKYNITIQEIRNREIYKSNFTPAGSVKEFVTSTTYRFIFKKLRLEKRKNKSKLF
jgi:hypothetical protein